MLLVCPHTFSMTLFWERVCVLCHGRRVAGSQRLFVVTCIGVGVYVSVSMAGGVSGEENGSSL